MSPTGIITWGTLSYDTMSANSSEINIAAIHPASTVYIIVPTGLNIHYAMKVCTVFLNEYK